ncbi:RELT-like protein 1 isoform X2 [Alosa sapidissima]|uniref:RELT-like protein 1 isoform X2 n=1 Tax=Alosa sapidissima TaxID=34773 RepID=UPI001C0A0127|nr:RELT-like protein 1 isoform X2 [Alosa sapidissima]
MGDSGITSGITPGSPEDASTPAENSGSSPEYVAFGLVPVFFLLGLLGVLICHALKKKGYRCTTEAEDAQAAEDELEKDLERAARLQVLPTKYNRSLWFPSIHSPLCVLHDPPQHLESVAHITNSCTSLKGLYIARHNRLVDLIAAQIPCVADEKLYKNTTVQSDWFNSPANTLVGIPNTPDIVVISQHSRTVKLFEVACAFDLFMFGLLPF